MESENKKLAVEPTISINGTFLKEDEFEKAWFEDNVRRKKKAKDTFGDDDFIDYRIWEDQNYYKMYKKYLPEYKVFRGNNPNIIFHGGCLGCVSQRNHGIDRCKGCQYFKGDWNKPDLSLEGDGHK